MYNYCKKLYYKYEYGGRLHGWQMVLLRLWCAYYQRKL